MSNALGPLACLACLACASLDLACAPRVGATNLTSAEISTRLEEEAASEVRGGKAERALELANRAVRVSPASPWAHYDRAVALHALGRADEAVRDFKEAEQRFSQAHDAKGKSIAIYGRARALHDAGRCAEARMAYEEHADLVRAFDPPAADRALAYAKDCRETGSVNGDRAASNVASALIGGDYVVALEIAARESPEDPNPWLAYNRGVALGELGRTDEAVAAFVAAERGFGHVEANRHGRAVAIYGRARALVKAGRCPEARRACEEYATFTGSDRNECRRC